MSSSFGKMDIKKYKNLLNETQEKYCSNVESIDFLEKKYQELISRYSNAYLQGCMWYVGPSFKNYLCKSSLNELYNVKIEYIRELLLNQ
mgnify:FL=1